MTTPTQRVCQALAGLAMLAFLFGCKTTYEMQVDAISNPSSPVPNADSYVLVPRDPSVDTNDLRYKETVSWIKTALSAKGMYETLDPATADMVIEVDYGMEPPRQEIRIVQEPVFHRVKEPDTYHTVAVRDPETGQIRMVHVRSPGRISTQLVGYQDRAETVVVNEKYLVLTAKENRMMESGDTPPEELWSVTVSNEDSSDDLREYLPIMASAATDYIGADTQTEKTVKLKSDDEVVVFVKRGLEKEPL